MKDSINLIKFGAGLPGGGLSADNPGGCLAGAREKVEDWRSCYNEERPHGAIGNVLPVALMNAGSATNPLPERARKL